MEVIIKAPEQKIVDPSRDPDYKAAVKAGEERAKTMKFESDSQKRDYERRIAANPNNVYGLPDFYPAKTLRFSNLQRRTQAEREADELSVRIAHLESAEIVLYCDSVICRGHFNHYINREWSICENCKTRKSYKLP